MNRYERIMSGAATWCAYYRYNPHRFVADYLHVKLRLFQKILIIMMNLCTVVTFIGARGIGKTFLSAIFCVTRAILYPGSKICIASGTRGQALAVLEKIMLELVPNSPELRAEIDDKQTKVNGTDAKIVFRNSSFIKVVTAGDSSRGNRANVLLLDEFRLIRKDVIDTILRKFLTQRRMPRYEELTDAARLREYDKEKNMTMYLSSAYFSDHWSYTKCKDTFKAMMDENRRQFVCGLPYQLSISEGLLDADTVADEMVETDFNEIKFSMEYEALWWGTDSDSFFDYLSVSKNRRIKYAMLPDRLSAKLGGFSAMRIGPKQNGEVRILSADIALMSSKRNNNDATAVFINQMSPTRAKRYTSNIVYANAYEGLRTEAQALEIRKLFDEYQCDYIVLDCAGIGLGVFDCLARDMLDPDTGEIYPALSCVNDKLMAERCTVPGAPKVIWSIKASAQFNSDCAFLLREGFRSGKIRLLVSEYDVDELLADVSGYNRMSPADRVLIQMPYINTTLLIDELVKLRHEENGGKVRIYERAGMRKDRYSSLAYNYYVACQLETRLAKRSSMDDELFAFVIKAPKLKGRTVNGARGRGKDHGWR